MTRKNPFKIAICDNQPIVVEGLTGLFNSQIDFDLVGTASSGNEIRNLLQEEKEIDTLLIDLKLPRTNVYRLIKDFVIIHPNVKIIAFTDYDLQKLITDMMDFGVSAYLGKSASIDEILSTIKKVHLGNKVINPSSFSNCANRKDKISNLILKHKDDFSKISELTEREMDVVILMCRGLNKNQIVTKLKLSDNIIETHRKNIINKFNLNTTEQLNHFANQQGFI